MNVIGWGSADQEDEPPNKHPSGASKICSTPLTIKERQRQELVVAQAVLFVVFNKHCISLEHFESQ